MTIPPQDSEPEPGSRGDGFGVDAHRGVFELIGATELFSTVRLELS